VTVVLALRCEDGLVLAADSQITERHRGMSYPAQKLHPMGANAAWGGSGARSVLLELQTLFSEDADEIVGSREVERAMQERVIPVLRHHYDNYIEEVPGEESGGTPAAYVLAAGYSHDEPWIVEVNPHGIVSRYDEIGFHAIGSGAALAQQAGALLTHFRMTERPVAYGVTAAVRVLDALEVTSPSVGGPMSVCRILPDGVEPLDEDDLDAVRKDVERWKQAEQQVLDDLLS
jgi:proteasome beta subunit